MKFSTFMIIVGFAGQAMFSGRFLIQWIMSEKNKKSIVPYAFWIFSILGGALLLIYAIYKKDPVIIVGQLFGLIVYIRNLIIIKNSKEKNRKI